VFEQKTKNKKNAVYVPSAEAEGRRASAFGLRYQIACERLHVISARVRTRFVIVGITEERR